MKFFGQKKICLLYTGGLQLKPDINITELKKWLKNFFELQIIAKVEPVMISPGNSAVASWELAKLLSLFIKENYHKFDGFVITHGIDNALYISSLMSFMVQNTQKPIVFVSAITPPEKIDYYFFAKKENINKHNFTALNARASLMNAIQSATLDIGEVGIVLGNYLYRAVQAQISNNKALLAKIQFGTHLTAYAKKSTKEKPKFNLIYNDNIKIIDIYPGLKLDLSDCRYQGIFIRGLQEESIIDNWQVPKNIPVCLSGKSKKDKPVNYIYYENLMPETALAKFVWCLGYGNDPRKIQKLMKQNLVGEY